MSKLKMAVISDIHIGKLDYKAKDYYEKELLPFLNDLEFKDVNVITVLGDISDRNLPSSSEEIFYYHKFMTGLMMVAKEKDADLILLHGTPSHEGKMFSNIEHYKIQYDKLHIIHTAAELLIRGFRFLCIPHEFVSPDNDIYLQFRENKYDYVFLHGVIEGVPFYQEKGLYKNKKAQTWSISELHDWGDYIIAGHFHDRTQLSEKVRYVGSYTALTFHDPYNKPRGYEIITYDMITGENRISFYENKNRRKFITLNVTDDINNPESSMFSLFDNIINRYDKANIRIKIDMHNIKEEEFFKINQLEVYNKNRVKIFKNDKEYKLVYDLEQLNNKVEEIIDNDIPIEEAIKSYIEEKNEVNISILEISEILEL